MTTAPYPIEFAERTAAREWSIAREFNAPRELVFKAWIVPSLLARWWGPNGFTTPVCETDPRPGGEYRIVMRDPDGVEYPVRGVYRDVVEPERIVMTDVWDEQPEEWQQMLRDRHGADEPAMEALNTISFDEHGGVTTVTIRSLFGSSAVRDAMVDMGMDDGWTQSFDRLDDLLSHI